MPATRARRPNNDWLAVLAVVASVLAILPKACATFLATRFHTYTSRPMNALYHSAKRRLNAFASYVYWFSVDAAMKASPIAKKQLIGEEDANPSSHPYLPPPTDASRSPCPALNVMANHGYIPRDGRSLTAPQLIAALQKCYNLSLPLAYALAYGAFLKLGVSFFKLRSARIDLHDLARAGVVEHPASLVHAPAPVGGVYAPVEVDPALFDALVRDADEGDECVDVRALARARVRREAEEGKEMNCIQRVVALGESALVLLLLGSYPPVSALSLPVKMHTSSVPGPRVALRALHHFLRAERLPPGWCPPTDVHQRGTLRNVMRVGFFIGVEVMRLRFGSLIVDSKTKVEAKTKAEVEEEKACVEVGEEQILLEGLNEKEREAGQVQVQVQVQVGDDVRVDRHHNRDVSDTPNTTPALTPTSLSFASSASSAASVAGSEGEDVNANADGDADTSVCTSTSTDGDGNENGDSARTRVRARPPRSLSEPHPRSLPQAADVVDGIGEEDACFDNSNEDEDDADEDALGLAGVFERGVEHRDLGRVRVRPGHIPVPVIVPVSVGRKAKMDRKAKVGTWPPFGVSVVRSLGALVNDDNGVVGVDTGDEMVEEGVGVGADLGEEQRRVRFVSMGVLG